MNAAPFTKAAPERGAVQVMAAVGMVVAVIASALAIDIGRLAQERRNNQKVADMAALDTVRALVAGDDLTLAAGASAQRNGFPWATAGYDVTAQPGTVVDGAFVPGPLAGATAVEVTVSSPFRNYFAEGSRTVSAKARSALAGPLGSVAVGSTLAGVSGTVGATEVRVLNRFLSRVVAPGTVSVDAVGWKGIADASVTFERLRTALGLSAGTVDGVLDAQLTYRQLLDATVSALQADGTATSLAAATPLAQIASQVSAAVGATFTVRDLFSVVGTIGDGQDVANATLRVLDIVRGGAVVADGDHFVSFDLTSSDVGAIPGFNFARVKLGLIEGPQAKSGPPGTDTGGGYLTTASTSQLRALVEVHLRIVLSGLGLTDVRVPFLIEAGTARAHLHAMACTSPSPPARVDIRAETDAATARLGAVGDAALSNPSTPPTPVPTRVVDVAGLVTVDTNSVVTATAPGNPGTTLSYFPPYEAGSPSQRVSATALALPSLAVSNLTVNVLLLGLNGNLIALDVSNGTNAATPGVMAEVFAPLARALGITYAGADVWAPPPQRCTSGLVSPNPASSGYTVPALIG